MKQKHTTIEHKELLVIDHSAHPYEGELLFPFAVEELLCRQVGEDKLPPIAYFWRHQKGLVLGLRDRRLPFAEEAMTSFEQDQFQVAVRHSGGAAVPLQAGVVNFSLLLPKPKGQIDFRDDFNAMYLLIKQAVESIAGAASATGAVVEKGEIATSYCPGDYDLSIGGRKFCGLAQRRQTGAMSVQAFILASGSGRERAGEAQRYYELATRGDDTLDYPRVSLDSMGSLSELIGLQAEETLVEAIKQALGKQYTLLEAAAIPLESSDVEAMIERLKDRYSGRTTNR